MIFHISNFSWSFSRIFIPSLLNIQFYYEVAMNICKKLEGNKMYLELEKHQGSKGRKINTTDSLFQKVHLGIFFKILFIFFFREGERREGEREGEAQ